MSFRQCAAYGLIAGLTMPEIRSMDPGPVLDLFVYRRRYDDVQHRIVREKPKIYD